MAKYIDIPFAVNGNKTVIPDTTTDGTVNYNDGFGADYAKPIGTDPSAKSVDRETINQALYDYGSAIQQLQENGFYPWQSTKAGGYDIGAAVSFNGANYINEVAGNTKAPNVSGWTRYANINGNNTQAFKVANATNADEALSMGQLVNATALAGSNVEQVNGVQGALLGVGGQGYSWVDETSNRALGTTYTNTYGKPMQVSAEVGSNGSNFGDFYVNGTVYSLFFGANCKFELIIPAGATYKMTASGNIEKWSELK